MKTIIRSLCLLLLPLAASTLAQGASTPQGSSQSWREIETRLGLKTTYSVDMVVHAMGMDMTSRVYRDGSKTRTEMTLPFMNIRMALLEIHRDGRDISYSLFPDKRKYMVNEPEEDAGDVSTSAIEDLGSEDLDGETCLKRRVTVVQDGSKAEMVLWLSPRLHNMPVQMKVRAEMPTDLGRPPMPIESTVRFQNYDFSAPSADRFEIPAGYTRISDMMEIMMDGAEGLGALMEQFQNLMAD